MGYRFQAIAERWLKPVLRSDPEWMCPCPWCENDNSLQFSIEKGVWICFRCDERGRAERIVKKLGGSYQNPAMDLDELDASLMSLDMPEFSSARILPESTLGRYKGPPHEYWTLTRKYSSATIERFQLGYDPLTDRLTIPYRNPDGGLLGVIQRRLDNEFPRYLYPRGFDRKGSLFGSWDRSDGIGDSAVLVEGSTDAVWVCAAGSRSLAQYGSSLHPRQVRLLHRLGVKEVTLFYDFDPAGIKAFKQAPEVLEGFLVRRVFYDSDRYCWHEKLCGCREGHTPFQLAHCPRKVLCRCGKRHCPDPGSLTKKEIRYMLAHTALVGKEHRKTWSSSGKRTSSSPMSAQRVTAGKSR